MVFLVVLFVGWALFRDCCLEFGVCWLTFVVCCMLCVVCRLFVVNHVCSYGVIRLLYVSC